MNKLREKFEKLVPEHYGGMSEELQEQCEQITDDFSVKFAEWLDDKSGTTIQGGERKGKRFYLPSGDFLTPTELLQIFKNKYYE